MNPCDCKDEARRSLTMPFGMYRGETIESIADRDILYVDWLNGTYIKHRGVRAEVKALCEERAAEIEAAMEVNE